MTTPLTVAQAQHVNRARSLAVARRLSDAALDVDVVCITIFAADTSIQLGSTSAAHLVARRLGFDTPPAVTEHDGRLDHTFVQDVDGIVVRVVGLDRIGGAS